MVKNIRSVRDYKKKLLLISLLRQNEIDIAFLKETFLGEESDLYVSGYRVYRANGINHRKGIPILINNDIDLSAMKVNADA